MSFTHVFFWNSCSGRSTFLFSLGRVLLKNDVNTTSLYVRYWIPLVYVLILVWMHTRLSHP